jgi:hypothetical protein
MLLTYSQALNTIITKDTIQWFLFDFILFRFHILASVRRFIRLEQHIFMWSLNRRRSKPFCVDETNTMCLQVVERYAVCHCVYVVHEVDACPMYGQLGHNVTIRTIYVGYLCPDHTSSSESIRETSNMCEIYLMPLT